MCKHLILTTLLISAVLTSTADAVTVKRTRSVDEPITVDDLLHSLLRGLGLKLAKSLDETDTSGLQAAVKQLDVELEKVEFRLYESADEKAEIKIDIRNFNVIVKPSAAEFNLENINRVSQVAEFWATIKCRRIHFRQEIDYLPGQGLVVVEIKVLNTIDRVTRLDFFGELYETNVGEQTGVTTSLTTSACVPGRPNGLIHRKARGIIVGKSDQALVTLDRKVREIVHEKGNFIDLARIVGERALGN